MLTLLYNKEASPLTLSVRFSGTSNNKVLPCLCDSILLWVLNFHPVILVRAYNEQWGALAWRCNANRSDSLVHFGAFQRHVATPLMLTYDPMSQELEKLWPGDIQPSCKPTPDRYSGSRCFPACPTTARIARGINKRQASALTTHNVLNLMALLSTVNSLSLVLGVRLPARGNMYQWGSKCSDIGVQVFERLCAPHTAVFLLPNRLWGLHF